MHVLRIMRVSEDGLPTVKEDTRDCLGVRYKKPRVNDIAIDVNGMVIRGSGGLSVTLPPKTNFKEHLLEPSIPARECFRIDLAYFEEHQHLFFRQDSSTHGLIEPSHDMHIDEYHEHLAATRNLWEVDK
ncbi:Hypothetical protein SCC1_4467 (plasmid) [Pectobacterium versatile]|uniref:hypothetical protein n=1 Tax=Pectobacterium versatile TaxID=2488639 RepID=UPI000B7BDCF0|nr:hypothetical protein [Pectobacterium versatile]ASN87837.1 Hypothetical protein SCC1_4467 [Pectobacterium versatile]